MQQILHYSPQLLLASDKHISRKYSHRKSINQFHPTFTSLLVNQIMRPYGSPTQPKSLQHQNTSNQNNQDVLDTARIEFINKKMVNINQKKIEQNKQMNKKVPYLSNSSLISKQQLKTQRKVNQKYNFTNEQSIHKKQSKNFDIISLIPRQVGKLRQHHNLTSQNKIWLKQQINKLNPELI